MSFEGPDNTRVEIPDREVDSLTGFDEGTKTAILAIEQANRDLALELAKPGLTPKQIDEINKAIEENRASLASIYNIGDSDSSVAA